jgi:ORF6N domain
MAKKIYTHPDEAIILNIRYIRWQKVLLDSDLAKLYWVPTKVLNQSVQRNSDRFPQDFMFQLTEDEVESNIIDHIPWDYSSEAEFLRSQIVTSNIISQEAKFRSIENKKSTKGRWWYRYLPYAFTEQWIAMLSSVLNSPTAIHINIQIIRIFIKMRAIVVNHVELQQKIEALEQSLWGTNQAVQELYDLFIRLVEQDTDDKERKIGFRIINT